MATHRWKTEFQGGGHQENSSSNHLNVGDVVPKLNWLISGLAIAFMVVFLLFWVVFG